MQFPKRECIAAVLGSAAAVLLLLMPLPGSLRTPFGEAFSVAAHVLLMAGLAVLWVRCFPQRPMVLWAGLILCSAGMEGLQAWVGRSAEWTDWLFGVAGGGVVCFRGNHQVKGALLAGLILLPLCWEGGFRFAEIQAFPVLADSSSAWSRRNWFLQGVRLEKLPEGHFRACRVLPGKGAEALRYPGIFRRSVDPEWPAGGVFQTCLFWPDEPPVIMAVRVDDLPGNPSYTNRFQKEFSVTQGWNRISIPLDDSFRTPSGRSLHLDQIRQWGVFLVSDGFFDTFDLDVVRLMPKEEMP